MPNQAHLAASLATLTQHTYFGPALALIGIISYIVFSSRPGPSVYDGFERLGNPSWMPKFIGKGPQTLFSEGYNKVSTINTSKPRLITSTHR